LTCYCNTKKTGEAGINHIASRKLTYLRPAAAAANLCLKFPSNNKKLEGVGGEKRKENEEKKKKFQPKMGFLSIHYFFSGFVVFSNIIHFPRL